MSFSYIIIYLSQEFNPLKNEVLSLSLFYLASVVKAKTSLLGSLSYTKMLKTFK